MSTMVLFEAEGHKNVLLPDVDTGEGIQANQHLVIHGKGAVILDPGGHKVYSKVLSATLSQLKGGAKLEHIFLSHQDPDIVAAINGWLMTTDATAWCSKLWKRFVPHFGLDRLVLHRLMEIPDEGQFLNVGGLYLLVIPAHFLHSCGNFHLYDPVSRILYPGDLGSSVGQDYREVTDFDAHVPLMDGFHRRYMSSTAAMRAWVAMIRPLDVQMIAPQHGALFRGPEMVGRFLDWCETLECGIDHMAGIYKLPTR